MGERIRVLEVANQLGGYGGTERTLFVLTKYLNRERFEPRVYSRDGLGGTNIAGYEQMGVPLIHDVPLAEVLESFKPHIMHIHRAGWEEAEPIEAAKAAGVPIIVETNVFGRPDLSASGQQIDCHIFVSYFCMRRYHQWVGHPLVAGQYEVLYNPLDPDDYQGREFNRSYDVPVVGRYSRNDDTKWHTVCVDMFPHLRQAVPGVRYLIAGETDAVKTRFAAHQCVDAIEYLPMTHDRTRLMDYLERFHVFAHGADIGESFGIVISEAMAAGLPVVTHPSYGGRDNAQTELVDHGVTGFVVPDPVEYAAAVAFLLQNPEKAKEMGDAGRKKAWDCFDARKMSAGLERIFESFYARLEH